MPNLNNIYHISKIIAKLSIERAVDLHLGKNFNKQNVALRENVFSPNQRKTVEDRLINMLGDVLETLQVDTENNFNPTLFMFTVANQLAKDSKLFHSDWGERGFGKVWRSLGLDTRGAIGVNKEFLKRSYIRDIIYSKSHLLSNCVSIDAMAAFYEVLPRCPLTNAPMCSPVIAEDGFTYEEHALKAYLQEHPSPWEIAGTSFSNPNFYPNHTLKSFVNDLYVLWERVQTIWHHLSESCKINYSDMLLEIVNRSNAQSATDTLCLCVAELTLHVAALRYLGKKRGGEGKPKEAGFREKLTGKNIKRKVKQQLMAMLREASDITNFTLTIHSHTTRLFIIVLAHHLATNCDIFFHDWGERTAGEAWKAIGSLFSPGCKDSGMVLVKLDNLNMGTINNAVNTCKESLKLGDLSKMLVQEVQKSLEDLKCPFSLEPFDAPVVAADGVTYERSEIVQYFHSQNPPYNGSHGPFHEQLLTPNTTLVTAREKALQYVENSSFEDNCEECAHSVILSA